MKKVKLIILAVIGVMLLIPFESCKKGANDPAISFASRKGRLVGEWTVSKQVITYTSGTSTSITTYDDGSYTYNNGSGTITSGTYTWEWTISKDGTYKFTRNITISGTTNNYIEEGLWYFAGANKDEELKNKEMVCFQSTKRTYTSGGSTEVYTEEGNDLAWYRLDQLKSKEIIGTYEYSYTGTSTDTETIEITLTAK